MYFYRTNTIANGATGYVEVRFADLPLPELQKLHERSVLALEKGTGDVTLEDVRLVKEEMSRR